MRLKKIQITNYQSILDSTEFAVGDVTCLVGKNEAGKTALLKALYRLNPINSEDRNFDVTMDYPRQTMARYKREVNAGRREPVQVVRAAYALEQDDINAVHETFGTESLKIKEPTLLLTKGYSNELAAEGFDVDEAAILKHLVSTANLPSNDSQMLLQHDRAEDMLNLLDGMESSQTSNSLEVKIRKISGSSAFTFVFDEILQDRIPKFLYFDEYYQMRGQDNLDSLMERVTNNQLEEPDYPLLGLIGLAGLDLDDLLNPDRTQDLLADLDAAGSELTDTILPYWSQNKNLRMKFDIRPARPKDPPELRSGTNIWGLVENRKYDVTIPIETRSRGFVWFFSFLAWYSKVRSEGENLILLLDEPGLSLHAKAQGDLLRYFEKELKPHHQLIYTTHSPFMVDPSHFDRVRIVQDLSIEPNSEHLPAEQQGTKVTTDVLEATQDSLFPLQGALGYEIHQTLFIGPNSLVVEGASDLLYIQTISGLLQERGEEGLNPEWTITPVGGSDKVSTFVALIGAQSDLNVAVLIDFQKKDRQGIENLYKEKLLKKKQVLTYADYVTKTEADAEDMFDPKFYLEMVNGAYGTTWSVQDLPKGPPRMLKRIEQYLTNNPLPGGAKFNHYRPAYYFSSNVAALERMLTEPQLDRWRRAFNDLNALL